MTPRKRITTSASVDAAKPIGETQVDYPDSKVAGLALRVTPAGGKSWSLRYRTLEGGQRRITIGRYPTVGLSEARTAANKTLVAVSEGKDPAIDRRKAKAAAKAGTVETVSDLIERYFTAAAQGRHKPNGRPKRESTLTIQRGYFDRLVNPKFGKKSVTDLARSDVQAFLDDISSTSVSTATHCRNLIRESYNFAIRRELAEKNPAQLADIPAPIVRERVLTDQELRAIWMVASDPLSVKGLHLSPGMGLAICLAMVTLQRGGEVCGIHAREMDRTAKLWTIPGERTKNHRTHVVPLSDFAIDLIGRAYALNGDDTGYLFPSPRGEKPITRRACSRASKRLTKLIGVDDATPHDFRRTGSTNITSERIGIPRFIVSRVLNQISDTGGAAAVTSVYDRNEYLAQKRNALDAWASLLSRIVDNQPLSSNVVRISN